MYFLLYMKWNSQELAFTTRSHQGAHVLAMFNCLKDIHKDMILVPFAKANILSVGSIFQFHKAGMGKAT